MFIEISFTRYQECFTGIINQMYFQHNIPIAFAEGTSNALKLGMKRKLLFICFCELFSSFQSKIEASHICPVWNIDIIRLDVDDEQRRKMVLNGRQLMLSADLIPSHNKITDFKMAQQTTTVPSFLPSAHLHAFEFHKPPLGR